MSKYTDSEIKAMLKAWRLPDAHAEAQKLAVPPFHVTSTGLVIDATGSTVLACSEDTDCLLRFSEREVNKDGHFICPNCGRLGQRMIEASPEQCEITNVRWSAGLAEKTHDKRND